MNLNTWKVGRDARTGRFVSLKEALRRPATTIIQTLRRLVGKKDPK